MTFATGALAGGAGLALLVAQPPFGWWPLAFASPLLFAWALDRARQQDVPRWRVGALAGAALNVPLLAWLIAPAGYVGYLLLVAVQVGWFAVLAVLTGRFAGSWRLALALPLAWVGVDAWRSSIPLSGFVWGSIEYTQVDDAWLVPLARLGGGRAIALVVVLLGVLAYEALRRIVDAARAAGGAPLAERLVAALPSATRPAGALVAIMLLVALATIGPPPTSGSADVLLVQGNDIERFVGTSLELDETIAAQMLEETRRGIGGERPDIVIWPESSVDRDPNGSNAGRVREHVLAAAALADGALVAGANLDGPRPRTFLNAALHLDASGREVGRYVKRRLVPFGEYIPLRSWLDWFPPLQQVPRDAVPGDGPTQLVVDDVRLAVAICFESMFSATVRGSVLAGDAPAQLLVVSTNDATFGRSAEPDQHIAQTRLRAIETGRWAAHAAVSGRSAIIDPGGRVVAVTDLFDVTHLRAEIPLVDARTPYLVTGDWIGVAARAALVALALWTVRERRRRGA